MPLESHSSPGFGRGTGFVAVDCGIFFLSKTQHVARTMPSCCTFHAVNSADCQRSRMTIVTLINAGIGPSALSQNGNSIKNSYSGIRSVAHNCLVLAIVGMIGTSS
jgi:hypothetical protein